MLPAFLFMLPIVVVDVSGDRLDPAHTRKLVEHELGVTAVAPDDPRAAEATGHLELSGHAADKKLTVKYRKVDEPVERTVELPDDNARAETDAVFLAGNLARDEASELAPPRAKTEKPKRSIAESFWTEPDRELTQLHAFLRQTSSDERSSQTRTAAIELTVGAALLGTAAAIHFSDPKSTEVRAGGYGGAMVGGWFLGYGLAGFFIHPNPLEPIETKMKELEGSGASSAEVLEEIDKEWAKKAAEVKRGRIIVGSIAMGVGTLAVGAGAALAVAYADEEQPPSTGLSLIGTGLFAIVSGIASLVGESPLERSYRMWKTVRTPSDIGSNISFGATVLPGGGGAASFALTF